MRLLLFLTAVAVACLSAGSAGSAGGTVVHLDDAAAAHARSFDGVGALSGGGGTSILLSSYPDHVASDILDVLFKPGVAASLQMLKLEIGGDGQSTEAAESSHEHVQREVACTRGYEFALAKEAKARNPAIKLYGLPWSFPSWLAPHPTDKEDGTDPLGQDPNATAAYVANWVKCAKSAHGLHIDYVGVWNEMDDSFGSSASAMSRRCGTCWTRTACTARRSWRATCTPGSPRRPSRGTRACASPWRCWASTTRVR